MTLRALMSVWFWTLNTDWIGCVGVCSSSVHSAVKPLITRSVAATGSLIVPQLVMFMCIRVSVCVQIDWPVIRRLNGVCCPSALLIKLDWSGLVGTCHNQPKPHPSPADLATAWALGHCRGPPGPRRLLCPGTDRYHYPLDLEPGWPKERPLLLSNPGTNPSPWPSKVTAIITPEILDKWSFQRSFWAQGPTPKCWPRQPGVLSNSSQPCWIQMLRWPMMFPP